MSLAVHNQASNLYIQNQLNVFNTNLSKSFERLSSGLRINSAADDAAGSQISTRLETSQISSKQVARNLNDGISYSQIAEGALTEVGDMLKRMRQLSVQAQNGTLGTADRKALDAEFQQLKAEINNIAYETEAFGRHPLTDTPPEVANVTSIVDAYANGVTLTGQLSGVRSIAYLPSGLKGVDISINSATADDDIQIFTPSGAHIVGTPFNNGFAPHNAQDAVWNGRNLSTDLFLTSNGYNANASYNDSLLMTQGTQQVLGMNISFTGDEDYLNSDPIEGNNGTVSAGESMIERVQIDEIKTPLIISVVGGGVFSITPSWTGYDEPSDYSAEGDLRITTTTATGQAQQFIEIPKTPATTEDLGVSDLALDPIEAAKAALAQTDIASAQVAEHRATYGASINSIQSSLRSMHKQQEAAAAAKSRISDADYATETSELTKNQILQQSAQALLSQNSQRPNLVLSLLS
ncbi:flagellin [Catenovulum agarivorans DS-2]|uniref:Flagellin n=1 Tax=Catenovulum agarivorans DS-2 TaxID=1328313 RepID=W7Q6C4_9ALTE|nr:flagellin [Catenovulum agarivorans]EWH08314.1 flagellin [Catenovulum agarivorans DS-2]